LNERFAPDAGTIIATKGSVILNPWQVVLWHRIRGPAEEKFRFRVHSKKRPLPLSWMHIAQKEGLAGIVVPTTQHEIRIFCRALVNIGIFL
jgi:hypothetical protein